MAPFVHAVEVFQVTTNLVDNESGKTSEMKFSICLNEQVIDVVADKFIDYAQTLNPESSVMSEQMESLWSMICNEHTQEKRPTTCQMTKPAIFMDPINPFSSVNVAGETHRISVREGQTSESLTDCFCSKHTCDYHQGKYIENALSAKIAKAKASVADNKETIAIKASPSDKSSSSSRSSKKNNKKK
jgi:hypothetical protein